MSFNLKGIIELNIYIENLKNVFLLITYIYIFLAYEIMNFKNVYKMRTYYIITTYILMINIWNVVEVHNLQLLIKYNKCFLNIFGDI